MLILFILYIEPGSRKVPNAVFSLVDPTPVSNPTVVAYSPDALKLIGLSFDAEDTEDNNNNSSNNNNSVLNFNSIIDYFAGNKIIPGSSPAAHCYCGFQFGNFAGQLGDGATLYLGEVVGTTNGSLENKVELQLKGAGKTPYSRTADGRKVLRSSIREFLCSEAMHFLNIPTTRSGTCITSDSYVERDPMYDGNPVKERCTVISRLAENFFRFGSFEIFKQRDDVTGGEGPSAGNVDLKKQLLDYILRYYNNVSYESFFEQVMNRTISLVAMWQSVGFVHGVLNTDNMSVMGLTIDYGPYGFMEQYDEDFVPNGSDNSGRYSYKNQPKMCKWNLEKFAEALSPLLPLATSSSILNSYDEKYEKEYLSLMKEKFGFITHQLGDEKLISEFFETMQSTKADFTQSFVTLTKYVESLSGKEEQTLSQLVKSMSDGCASPDMVKSALKRKMKIHRLSMHPQQIQYLWTMLQSDPQEISRLFGNAPVAAIRDEVSEEKKKLDTLVAVSHEIKALELLDIEEKSESDANLWKKWCENYIKRIKVDKDDTDQKRITNMKKRNPTFILRNWVLQEAIVDAERGDYSTVKTLLKMCYKPHDYDLQNAVKSKSEAEKRFLGGGSGIALNILF